MKNTLKLAALVALGLGLIAPTTGFAQTDVDPSTGAAKGTMETKAKEKKAVKHKKGKAIKKEKMEKKTEEKGNTNTPPPNP